MSAYAAHLWVPDTAVGDFGEDVAQFSAEELGRPLDGAQREAVGAMTSYDKRGRWAAFESAVVEARQNGKTAGTITPIVLWDLFTNPRADRCAWTAHLFKTTREAFEDHKALIDGNGALSGRVKRIAEANGNESIELVTGRRIDYLARSKGGGRGIGGERIVIDETLLGWTGAQASALLPILAARSITGDPCVMYGSSAALKGAESDYLRSLAKRGRSQSDPALVWVEHCAPGGWADPGCRKGTDCSHLFGVARGCALDDEGLYGFANPALDVRLSREFLRKMRRTMSPDGFGREFLGWHEEPDGDDVPPIDGDVWAKLADAGSIDDDPRRVFAVQVAANGRSACIAEAGRRDDGLWHVEIIDDRPEVSWLLDRLEQLLAAHPESLLVVMQSGPSGQLVPELLQRDVPIGAPGKADGHRVELLTLQQHAQGCGLLDTLVREARVRHLGDPRFTVALAGARKRTAGDGGWVWSIRDSVVDPLHLIAITNALVGAVRREDWTGVDPLAGLG